MSDYIYPSPQEVLDSPDHNGYYTEGSSGTKVLQNVALSKAWATNPVDDPVETLPEEFSSLHWASKSNDQAILSKEYANSPENVLVPGTSDYSAYHWSRKAYEYSIGVSIDHGALLGLESDDHPQYLDYSRADARYSRLSNTGTAASKDAQTSTLDPTAGALMVVGAFGLGALAPITDANDVPIGGSFSLLRDPFTNGPDANNYLLVSGYGGGYGGSQLAIPFGSATKMYSRVHSAGSWGAWTEIWTEQTQLEIGTTAASARTALALGTAATSNAADFATVVSPTLAGDPKAPTPAAGDNDTSIATTAYVMNKVTISASAPSGGANKDVWYVV